MIMIIKYVIIMYTINMRGTHVLIIIILSFGMVLYNFISSTSTTENGYKIHTTSVSGKKRNEEDKKNRDAKKKRKIFNKNSDLSTPFDGFSLK